MAFGKHYVQVLDLKMPKLSFKILNEGVNFMKRILTLVITFGLLLGFVELSNAQYTILFSDGFETAWSGNYWFH